MNDLNRRTRRRSSARISWRGTAFAPALGSALLAAPLASAAPRDGGCLPADINGDGVVDGADVTIILGEWSGANPDVDIDGSGLVDGGDIAIVLGYWSPSGPTCVLLESVAPAAVPSGEPFKITGIFPPVPMKDVSIVGQAAAGPQPMKATVVTSRSIAGKTGLVPTAQLCALTIELGEGAIEPVTARIPGATLGAHNWSWKTNEAPPEGGLEFTALPPSFPLEGTRFGSLKDGSLSLVVDDELDGYYGFGVWVRAHHDSTSLVGGAGYLGLDARIPCLTPAPRLSRHELATAVAAAIEATFAAHVPTPIIVECAANDLGGGASEITLTVPGHPTTSGFLILTPVTIFDDCECDVDGDMVTDCVDNCWLDFNPDQADADRNGVGDVCDTGRCEGCWYDFNGDDFVDGADFALLIANSKTPCAGTPYCCADLNEDGMVDQSEVFAYIDTYSGQFCRSPASLHTQADGAHRR